LYAWQNKKNVTHYLTQVKNWYCASHISHITYLVAVVN